ncbi:transmembrane protein 231 isoform X2 [Cephus cinctus]|uniref:Transmembrane protein 231 n=1 Tax=Cephus cinctus TaxID=211228 RepID=A0AAJ7C2C1_CEPCN|nr:transmembrane protein 231 isoform X2 [Cephus cinctus]
MAILEIFSSNVKYKYKTSICSSSALLVLFLSILTLLLPLIIVYHTGGFWLKNAVYMEKPNVIFKQKYLLLAERQFDALPITCSTFTVYKENPIKDDCQLVYEVDENKDGQKDILKFEAHFYTDLPLRFIRLLLFFNYELTQYIALTMETVVVFDYPITQDVQEVHFNGQLKLQQKTLLRENGLQNFYNRSMELEDRPLSDFISENENRKFAAKITNTRVTWQAGFSKTEKFVIRGIIFYSEDSIQYQPGFWQELKWAWIQYISILLIFIFLEKRILEYMFTHRYLRSYTIVPWEIK